MLLILLTWPSFCICNKQSNLYIPYECYIRFASIPNTDFVFGCCSVVTFHLEVPEVVIISILGVIHQNMIGVMLGWSRGDIALIGIIKTVQKHTSSWKIGKFKENSWYSSSLIGLWKSKVHGKIHENRPFSQLVAIFGRSYFTLTKG